MKLEQEPRITPTGLVRDVIEWCRKAALRINERAELDSPTFTGDPKAPTPASSDNDTSIITSAWAKLGLVVSAANPGYLKLPDWLGGVVIQWGSSTGTTDGTGHVTVLFTSPFTTLLTVVCSNGDSQFGGSTAAATVYGSNVNGFTALFNGAASVGVRTNWIAIGV